MAAWNHEVLAETLFERTLLGESVLFSGSAPARWSRSTTGVVIGNAPLSLGRKEGDCVRCMYHGLKYGPDGRCVEIPGAEACQPTNVRVRTYPVVERKRWIWIWMGDPAAADENLIPDTFSLQDPAWRTKPGYLHYDANHFLIADNLLDFSHLSYVHESTLGGTSRIAETRATMERLPRGVRLTRRVLNATPAPYHVRLGAPRARRSLVDLRLTRCPEFCCSTQASSPRKMAATCPATH